MNLSAIAIRRPVFAWMLMFGLICFGAISFTHMGISQMPDVDFPVVNVSLALDGAAPEMMESHVVDVIEDAIMGIQGLSSITSRVSQGTANITCSFEGRQGGRDGKDVGAALQDVQTRITQASRQLPTALYPPVITKTNPEDQPIVWVMVTADASVPLHEQMIYARNTLKNQLTTLTGVGSIQFAGYVEPSLRVEVDASKMYSYELTTSDLSSAITAEQIEQPAGRIEAKDSEMNIRVLGEARTPEDFARIRINTRGGGANYKPISLGSVARVREGVGDLRAISRYDGKQAVGLGVIKQRGANAVAVADLVRARIEQLKPSLPKGYNLDLRLDSTRHIRESVGELKSTLLLSALLTSIVCFLFLGTWSSTINVLLAIPTSIVGAFMALDFFGFTLNTFTLLGLSLAIGIVVDDAIMMLENIVRHKEMGKNRRQAALDGSREITFAAIATTAAIAAIFIPVVFMRGVVGRYFYQYGVTVTAAVALSLLEALTLTPMRSARFLPDADQEGRLAQAVNRLMAKLSAGYQSALRRVLAHRIKVVAGALAIFAASLGVLQGLRKELVPEQDQSQFALVIKTPVGTSLQATDRVFKQAEAYLTTQPEILGRYATVGGYQGNNVVNAGTIYVTLKEAHERKATQRQVMDRVRAELNRQLKPAVVFTQDPSLAGMSASRGFPIEFVIEGPDWQKLTVLSDGLIAELEGTGLFEDLNSDYQIGMPEIRVEPDRELASLHGLGVAAMGQEISALLGGTIFGAATEYPKQGHRYPIRLRAEDSQHDAPTDIGKLLLRNNRGELIPLSKATRIHVTQGPQLISRVGRARAISIFSNVVSGRSQQDALHAVESAAQKLPPGYRATITGSAQAFKESFESLIFALILGLVVAYMVLASQFNSFLHPISVLMALPFSLSGAFVALWATGQSLSLYSMIGLILLMGIVKKNSILLVDFTNQRRAAGLKPTQALLEACPVRLRPIIMTSAATVVGAIPGALNWGPGAETRVPMAAAIIGGVTLSTLLTLFVVPCVYSLLARLERPDAPEFDSPDSINAEPAHEPA